MRISERLPRETGRDYALRILKSNIVSLDLAPGSMVSENELAAALGLSRTPVREALIELSKVNIVEIYPQKGSRIALIDSNLVDQAYFMRETLEAEVLREACKTRTEADIERLRAAIRSQDIYLETGSLKDAQGEEISFMQLDNNFHELLYQITGKELIYRIIQEIVIHFDRVRNLTINYVKQETIVQQHKDILKAIIDRDDFMAVALNRKHLNRFRGIQSELIEQHPDYFRKEAV